MFMGLSSFWGIRRFFVILAVILPFTACIETSVYARHDKNEALGNRKWSDLPKGVAISIMPPVKASDGMPKQIVIFGNESCPKSPDEETIIVCRRLPESERYRIPVAMREEDRQIKEEEDKRVHRSWAQRVQDMGLLSAPDMNNPFKGD
ncbi:hypothetical protein ZMO02_09920 [Zymomonas mobilis subsp. pomaceae]|uniref:Lipoprotein n=2 Tax=Zymomonas mobilis TaxID=542 RepID=F8EVJ9_ZYMMT|nr:hypothetical protein Zymop_1446 [Zymomonas mobilis subsp. pomaceae ATCC 29192]GEB89355.1 hypothetical protein ZMO02_09920 [Zymomonas mobilis subsp. pomaceae]